MRCLFADKGRKPWLITHGQEQAYQEQVKNRPPPRILDSISKGRYEPCLPSSNFVVTPCGQRTMIRTQGRHELGTTTCVLLFQTIVSGEFHPKNNRAILYSPSVPVCSGVRIYMCQNKASSGTSKAHSKMRFPSGQNSQCSAL